MFYIVFIIVFLLYSWLGINLIQHDLAQANFFLAFLIFIIGYFMTVPFSYCLSRKIVKKIKKE